jgi:hypothetical protein
VGIRRISVQGQPRQELIDIPSQSITWHALVISAKWEALSRKTVVLAYPRQNTRPYPKRAGMAQVVKHLSSKCQTLNSSPSTIKKKKKKRK